MKKKTLFLMLVIMFISTNALSQNIIHGKITGDVQTDIIIELYKTSCGGDALVGTFTTNAEGYYAFGCLDNGDYRVIPKNASYSFVPEFINVQIPQTVIQSYDFVANSPPCPPEMAFIEPEGFCIDRWEAHLVDHSPYQIPSQGVAASLPRFVPQGYISGVVASAACAGAGKRLCANDEWLRTCQGPNSTTYPYGDVYDSSACNDFRSEHPIVTAGLDWTEMNNPILNQLPDTVDLTGENEECVTPEGVYDLVGNLHEWTSDPSGTFRGGFYVEASQNGEGCLYSTTAQNVSHHDFSTGFRCCMDP